MGSRIENIQQRTKDRLNDLVQLNLVEISGSEKQEKGNAYVNVYKYTFFGHLLAWIIESFNPQKREKATKEIYNLFNSFYKQYKNWSYYVFSSALYKKYFDKGVFEDFVVDRIRETLDMNMEIWSMQELLFVVSYVYITALNTNINVYIIALAYTYILCTIGKCM
jgi:hypothetical protein